MLPEERTRAYWLGHLTKARQLAGFCQLVRSCLERPLLPGPPAACLAPWNSTASPTPVPIGCFGARHPLTRSGTPSTRVLAHCGGLSFCGKAAWGDCRCPRGVQRPQSQASPRRTAVPLRTCLDHCPGLSSGSLHLRPASRPESSKFEASTWRGNIQGQRRGASLYIQSACPFINTCPVHRLSTMCSTVRLFGILGPPAAPPAQILASLRRSWEIPCPKE